MPAAQIGCFISFPNQDSMRANLESHVKSLERQADLKTLASRTDSASLIDLIVVTDSEAVLGIGGGSRRARCTEAGGTRLTWPPGPGAHGADQGVGGITISLSKSALYTLGAGIQPNRILPVVLGGGGRGARGHRVAADMASRAADPGTDNLSVGGSRGDSCMR